MTNQNVEYCLGLAAEQTGVLLHGVCVMSNHWHGVVSDPEGRVPEFLERFHRLMAKVQNASLGRWENLWSLDKTSLVQLVSESDVLEKLAYTMANPTVAGLVKSPSEWPGVMLNRFGDVREVEMPGVYFDGEGDLPETVTLRIERPAIFPTLSDMDLQRELSGQVGQRVKRARDDMALRGLSFLGRDAVMRQSFSAMPKNPAPRRNPNPRIAAKSTTARVDAIRRMVDFVREYRAVWQEWRQGNRAAVFPHGTYALRIYARVACAPAVPA